MQKTWLTTSVLMSLGLMTAAASPAPPARELTCASTQIAAVEHRLQNGDNGPFVAGSGSAVRYANGLYQVSYEELPAIAMSRRGDPVFLCLVKLPENCPPGDDRGKVYTTTNLRTLESWTLSDSEHSCGGA